MSGRIRRRPGPRPICFHHPAQWGAITTEPNAGHYKALWTDWARHILGRSRRRAGKLESTLRLCCAATVPGFRAVSAPALMDLLRYARS